MLSPIKSYAMKRELRDGMESLGNVMDLKTLLDTPPWDWPSDAGRMFRKILMDQRAQESDRLIAAQLAGDVTVINDDLADCLLAAVRSANEPEPDQSQANADQLELLPQRRAQMSSTTRRTSSCGQRTRNITA